MEKIAVIVAGGSGIRMGTAMPKQFLLLNNKPILLYTLQTFFAAFDDIQVILVLPATHLEPGHEIIQSLPKNQRIRLVAGGNTRFHSVQAGLASIPFKTDAIIFVHDAVRCLLSTKLIQQCYYQAIEKGSAIPAIQASDSIRQFKNGQSLPVNRDEIYLIQTPQTFQSKILLTAFQIPYCDAFTDEATVVEHSGTSIHLIEGEHQNIKITRPIDLLIAEKFLEDPSLF
ncbi:2-C-methyl-D-erythritol 4-phosphate cytidylyltransferase [Hydrotalea sp.]|uniref:2-C-methyl-D-erythritol 4-phosphate cytidylyltransferase n=1 Tax=Hydrotalea sp. TaxID=2881279 RepID=UPI00260E09F5|nr:2-C-methyl-D-erythritol 4-phosphate cytidylyltransferase [Hydrotalea sp.]